LAKKNTETGHEISSDPKNWHNLTFQKRKKLSFMKTKVLL